MKNLNFRRICVLIIALWGMPLWAVASTADEQYRQALELVKKEQYTKAIPLFELLVSQYPQHLDYHYDFILTLGWAGKDQELLTISRKLDPLQTPPHVLEAIAKSARNEQQYELAELMYRLALRKDHNRMQSKIGLAYVLLETGHTDEATDMLLSMSEHNPKHIDVLEALATTYYSRKDYFKALAVYQKILTINGIG
jgi:tetratricopeptide (TPR) repeat protein